jgi:hypothetical protein
MDWRRLLLRVVYWVAVLAVSIAILVGLILLLESRDESSIEGGAWLAAVSPARLL